MKIFKKKPKIKLIAVDMDGTACEIHGQTIKLNIQPILDAQNKGVRVMFTTGRPVYNVIAEARKYQMEKFGEYIIAYNGATIWDLKRNLEWSNSYLDKDIVKQIFDISNRNNIGVWCYSHDTRKIITNLAAKEFPDAKFLQQGITIEQRKPDGNFSVNAYKLMIDNEEPQKKAHEEIAKICKLNKLNIAGGITPVYEINSSDINKGLAIQKLASFLKIKQKNIMAIGDGENDIPMFKYAGLSVAMGNAKDHIKQHADFVTDTEVNGGVAKAINKFIFNKNEDVIKSTKER